MDNTRFDTCWYLTGPTAAGKSTVGVELAERLDAEIVSMDSMALYRGMEIGTAKPTHDQRRRVAHRLIDCLEPFQESSLAQYLELAGRAVEDIRSRGRPVLFVGGTPLYLKALLRGIFRGPAADCELRRELHGIAEREGPEALHRRLVEIDLPSAERLHPNDVRRVVRALEVYEKTGTPLSEHQRQFDRPNPRVCGRVFCLQLPRSCLYARIDRRVVEMFQSGLVGEVRELVCGEEALSQTARQALGYKEVIEHLEGRRDLDETVELVQRRTRNFAKRQGTWFRSLVECYQVPLTGDEPPVTIADSIEALIESVRRGKTYPSLREGTKN